MAERAKHSSKRGDGAARGAPRSERRRAALAEPDFHAVFESAPESYLVLDASLTIVAANASYLRATMTTREGVVGCGMFEAFPDNPDDPNASGTRNLRASFERVLATRAADTMAVQKYDIPRPESEGGGFEERWWSPVNVPVLGPDAEVTHIIHRVEDVTEFVRLKQAGAEQSRLAEEQRRRADRMEAEVHLRAQEIQRVNEQLRHANEQLSALDELKTRFFSNVSHELRTPLTLLLGPVDELLAGTHGPLADDQREEIQVVRRNAHRLLKHVNALLDFSRIEASRVQMACEPTDLAALTAELAGAFRSIVERAGIAFVVDCPPLPEPVSVDREMWEKIVLNLVSNAFKFTFAGTIAVSLARTGDHIELTVRDTGVGIPDEELPRLFERFHRGTRKKSRTHEGSGIGLALVRELASLHGGTVSVSSTVGGGSEFTVRIPAKAEGRAECAAPRELGLTTTTTAAFVEEAEQWIGARPRLPERVAPRAPAQGSRPRVVVAEDNADMRRHLRGLLERDFEVETVADGVEALSAAFQRTPDLVLADVMMPGLDGLGLLRALRDDTRTRTVPVVLLSAQSSEGARVEALRQGADDYLIKPFSARELVARIGAKIELMRLRAEVATEAARRRESERRFRALSDAAPVMIWMTDATGATEYVNGTWQRFTGRSLDETRAQGWLASVHPTDRSSVALELAGVSEGRESFLVEFRLRRADGAWRWVVGNGVVRPGARTGAIGTCVDITARKQAERALRESEREREALLESERAARREAERQTRLKDELVATVSHELRTPLTGLLGWSTMLGSGKLDEASASRAMEVIERNARSLARLVEDLLDTSRISSGKLRISAQLVDLAMVTEECVASALSAADAKGVRIEQALDRDAGPVRGDPGRLAQVASNLLSNAIKFTPGGGRVEVLLRRAEARAELVVRDTGVGISEEFLPLVFDRFRQADASSSRRHGGLGLGLALVKQLVEMHGGEVRAESAGEGAGATFTVSLPLARSPSGDARATPLDVCGALAGAKVLVVDDEEDARQLVARILEECDAVVVTAGSVAEALEAVSRHRPEVLVSDLGMPQRDGYHLIRELRALGKDRGGETPAVALTAFARPQDRERALAAGFQAHVAKPVDPAELLSAVATAAGRIAGAPDGARLAT